MKICERGLNWFQIYNDKGDVRLCSWIGRNGGYIGNLLQNSVYDIWHGEKAQEIRQQLLSDDYSGCNIDACPYLANHEVDKYKVEYDLPEYPRQLKLAYENVCNYRCSSCTVPCTMPKLDRKAVEDRYKIIDERIREVLPHVESIGANGHGELFTSPHILKILSEWNPKNKSKAKVELETNGSLFDEEHWSKIANLGQYHLSVAITVMSFNEYTYQSLSGCSYPIQKIMDNLSFVSELRRKGIINYFELATVVQEQNFRTLPEFVKKCLSYHPDMVRVRPYGPWGEADPDTMWFKDMRGKYHPYHDDYMRIIKDPIMQDPRVYNWGGDLDSEMGELPSKVRYQLEQKKTSILEHLMKDDTWKNKISSYEHIVIYGLGVVGRVLARILKVEGRIAGVLDRSHANAEWEGLSVIYPNSPVEEWHDALVIVTPLGDTKEICTDLHRHGYRHTMDIRELISDA